MVRAYTPGSTEKYTMENSSWGARMDSVYGQEQMVKSTWENGKTTRSGAMVSINGLTVTNTKVNGLAPSRMVKVLNHSQTRISIQANIKMVNRMDMVNTSGSREQYLQVNSWKA